MRARRMTTRALIGTGWLRWGVSTWLLCFGMTWADIVCAGDVPASPVVQVTNCRTSPAHKAVLASDRPGLLTAVHVQTGGMVTQGMVVAALRDDVLRAQLATLEREASNRVDLEFSKKLLELANLEQQKALQINTEFRGTRSEVDMANLRVAAERARLQVEQAAFRIELAELKQREVLAELAGYRVYAPFAGVVLKVHKEAGETVTVGEPVAEIADFSRIHVDGYLSLAEAWRIQPGQPVMFRVEIPELDLPVERTSFSGTVKSIDPRIQELSQQVRVSAEVVNVNNELREGLLGTLLIRTDTEPRLSSGR